MSNDEIKTLETDVVIFPMKFGEASNNQISEETKKIEVAETQPQKIVNQKADLFARLKKSARKKSISIL